MEYGFLFSTKDGGTAGAWHPTYSLALRGAAAVKTAGVAVTVTLTRGPNTMAEPAIQSGLGGLSATHSHPVPDRTPEELQALLDDGVLSTITDPLDRTRTEHLAREASERERPSERAMRLVAEEEAAAIRERNKDGRHPVGGAE